MTSNHVPKATTDSDTTDQTRRTPTEGRAITSSITFLIAKVLQHVQIAPVSGPRRWGVAVAIVFGQVNALMESHKQQHNNYSIEFEILLAQV